MTKNVALVKKKQKTFTTTVQNYKNLLKKGDIKIVDKPKFVKRTDKNKRGVVYLGNIPHGFYEDQIKEYFRQFGVVTRLRLARSERTGRSKGFAFIEFLDSEVAAIVAETMNMYLMGKRLLKAQYIPPEKQHSGYFMGKAFTADDYSHKRNRKKNVARVNRKISEATEASRRRRILSGIEKVKEKLKSVGIDYDFQPVDVPDNLTLDTVIENAESEDNADITSNDSDDIVFQPPVKTITQEKTTTVATLSPKTKSFNKKDKSIDSPRKAKGKISGISKKNKNKPPAGMQNKKKNMIKTEILVSDQVKLKSAKDIKKNRRGRKNKNLLTGQTKK